MLLSFKTKKEIKERNGRIIRPMHPPKTPLDVQEFVRVQLLETERDNIVSLPRWVIMTKMPESYYYLWYEDDYSPSQCR